MFAVAPKGRPQHLRRRLGVAFVAVLAAVGTLTAVAPTAAQARPSQVDWQPCYRTPFECARVQVPLDYDDPHGVQISIAMTRLPALDQEHKVGTIFLNPGGPGGSGVEFVVGLGRQLFDRQVHEKFDIVGFDPRGIGRSRPLGCFTDPSQVDRAFTQFPYPDSAKTRDQWFAADHYLDASCARRGGAILDHMSTADAARDLDRLRAAVGDDQLSYYGVSYGSFLGNVYANLFPGRVRAVVIDGVLDPVAWTTGTARDANLPFSTRLHSAAGAMATLDEFFRLCDAGGRRCAFAPNSEQRFLALYRQLRDHPFPIGGGLRYDQTFLMGAALGAMYDSSTWDEFAQYLAGLEAHVNPTQSKSGPGYLVGGVEGFAGVACSDSMNPSNPEAWTRAAKQARRTDGLFGPIWTWASSACADWPGQDADRYLGPFDRYTAHPVLVVGNEFDPATPYQGAQTAARLLPNSSLLTVHGWGHTSLFLSACADAAIARYLLTTRTPAPGTTCQQDIVPFRPVAKATPRPPYPLGPPVRIAG